MASGINLVSQESERSENAVLKQGADAALPTVEIYPVEEVGG